MACNLEYYCGCIYVHLDNDEITMVHGCTDHKIIIAGDALRNMNKRLKQGSSKVF